MSNVCWNCGKTLVPPIYKRDKAKFCNKECADERDNWLYIIQCEADSP